MGMLGALQIHMNHHQLKNVDSLFPARMNIRSGGDVCYIYILLSEVFHFVQFYFFHKNEMSIFIVHYCIRSL